EPAIHADARESGETDRPKHNFVGRLGWFDEPAFAASHQAWSNRPVFNRVLFHWLFHLLDLSIPSRIEYVAGIYSECELSVITGPNPGPERQGWVELRRSFHLLPCNR